MPFTSRCLMRGKRLRLHRLSIPSRHCRGRQPEKLHLLARITFTAEGALERQVRAWASQQPVAAAAQERVDLTRIAFVAGLCEQAGMDKNTAQLRSRFFYLALVGRFAIGKRFELAPDEIGKMVDLLMAGVSGN